MRSSVARSRKPLTLRNFFPASSRPVAVQRSGWSPPCQRLTLRTTRSTVERHDSIGLVVARLRVAEGFTAQDFLQFGFGFGVTGHRVGVADAAAVVALRVFGQVFFDVAPLVQMATLHFGALAETRSIPARGALAPSITNS